jgi:class 3 adenylate cyclase
MPLCRQCGQENPEGFRFCGGCGAALTTAAPREVRKTVTFLFCDVTGSTALGERLDPETLRRVMRRYFDEISRVIDRHGGTVEKFVGDAVMAVFGIPRVREDDALRAVRAAAEIRDSLPSVARELGVKLAFRTGVNTGEVMAGDGQTFATGDAVNVAARLEQAAAPGEILIGSRTLRLVRDAVDAESVDPLQARGKAEPLPAHRLLAVRPGAAGLERRGDTSLIGREREMRLLRDVFERVVDERRCYLFTLLGAAGIGKSRLVRQFLLGVSGDGTVVRGRCLPYGEGITYWPLAEVLSQLGPTAAEVLTHVTEGGAGSPGELFFEVRRLLERVAHERPLIIVLDDLHWAEPTLLDLLDHIADLSRDAPILLLCIARPELLEERPAWAGGKLNATSVLLEPLPEGASRQLVAQLATGLDEAASSRIVDASEGNPLFLEEMVALLLEGGGSDVPPTIQALLAARLDRLAEPERAVIERGSVEGKVFHRRAIRDLAPDALGEGVDTHLAALVRKELIRPDAAIFDGDEAYRFRHLLIRDAAYDSLPKGTRAELHTAFAGWLEQNALHLAELDEIAGWHLEQAFGYWSELGLPGDGSAAGRAAAHLYAAGRRARMREDGAAAENLLGRAHALAPAGDPLRARAAVALAEVALERGRFEQVADLLDEAAGDSELAAEVVLVRHAWTMHSRPGEVVAYGERALRPLMAELERRGDDRLLARAHIAQVRAHHFTGVVGPIPGEALAAAAHARRAGDRALLTDALTYAWVSLVFGPADQAATERQLAAIDFHDAGPSFEAFDALGQAILAGRAGRFDEARAHAARSVDILEQVGLTVLRHGMCQYSARIELEAGNACEAVTLLRRGRDELERLGERAYRSTCTAMLADALYADGRSGEAERMALAAESESGEGDRINFAVAHGVRARVAADRGESASAAQLAESAIEYAYQMDMPSARADAQCVRAHVARAAGRDAEARTALEEAIAIYERKGELAAAARVRRDFDARPAAG